MAEEDQEKPDLVEQQCVCEYRKDGSMLDEIGRRRMRLALGRISGPLFLTI